MINRMSKGTQAEFAMLMVAFIWGTTFVMTKSALADIGPFLFLGIRFMIAFAVLAVVSWKHLMQIDRPTIIYGCRIGLFLLIGYSFQTVGLQYTSSSNTGFITGLSVVLVPIIYSALNRRMPGISTAVTIILAAAGLYFMSVMPGTFHLNTGDLLVLVCAVGFALHIISVDRYSFRFNPVAITAVQIFFVGIICLAIGLISEPIPTEYPLHVTGAILVTSIFATTVAFFLQNATQKYSTPTRFAVILTMEPVFAGMAGALWGGDILTFRIVMGMLLILSAMLMSILARSQ